MAIKLKINLVDTSSMSKIEIIRNPSLKRSLYQQLNNEATSVLITVYYRIGPSQSDALYLYGYRLQISKG